MKKKFKDTDLPIYEVMIDDEDETTGFNLVSIVQDPAIGIKAMAFNDIKDVKVELKSFADEQRLAGPALIPDIKIYRNDKFGEYFLVFTKDQIKKMVNRFNKNGTNRKVNFNHSNQMVDGFIEQSWIIKDTVYDGSRAYGYSDLPVGAWFIVCKVDDKKFWDNKVKSEGFFGFSVEGLFGMKLVKLEKHINDEIDEIIKNIDDISNLLS